MTLTEANHVVFINEWWNPSANTQAHDRAVRLGQERVVHVHRFRCKGTIKGTIEDVLDQILARKSEAFANIVDALASGARRPAPGGHAGRNNLVPGRDPSEEPRTWAEPHPPIGKDRIKNDPQKLPPLTLFVMSYLDL